LIRNMNLRPRHRRAGSPPSNNATIAWLEETEAPMKRNLRIGLIGGGLAGLAAAIALSRRGFEVRVYERAADITEAGAGITLMPNAIKVLRAFGLENAVKQYGFEPDAIVTRDWQSGVELSRIRSKDTTRTRFGAGAFQVHRADLRGWLLGRLPSRSLELDAHCASVANTPDGAVATFVGGRQEEADLIVGCDGIRSIVRDCLFGRQPARFTGNMCWRALVEADVLPRGHVGHDLTIWMGRRGHVVTYYVRGEELLNVVAIHEASAWIEESWSVEGKPSEMIAAYPQANENLRLVLERVRRCYKWGLFDRDPLPGWSKGRITLLGDAAHPMLPFLGQGAAMGFEDACILARELARSPADIGAALAAYQMERLPRTARVQLLSRAQGEIYHFHSPLARIRRFLKADRFEQRRVNLLSKDWLFDYDPTPATTPPESIAPISFGAAQGEPA
jgi:2-polyprenyl-6-methoxyphenol hydroxylase-like FAD-dependent oxidoreductase